MRADTLSPGTQLAGRYRIEDLVGETPRSQTWRALDRVLNRSVNEPLVGDDVHTLQERLLEMGYDVGRADVAVVPHTAGGCGSSGLRLLRGLNAHACRR